jgi:hypothetical protein
MRCTPRCVEVAWRRPRNNLTFASVTHIRVRVKTLTHVKATGSQGLLVAFGRREDAPDETWCMLFDEGSVATIARTGRELVFTARESTAPQFNPHLHWVVTMFFRTEAWAEKAEFRMRRLQPEEFFQGEEITGIIVQCGHSFQSIGVPAAEVDTLARRRGLTLTLVSPENSRHRDYYAVSKE